LEACQGRLCAARMLQSGHSRDGRRGGSFTLCYIADGDYGTTATVDSLPLEKNDEEAVVQEESRVGLVGL
jgi:hypothetical protein